MITTRGRATLLNRLINNRNQPIQNIVLGTGTSTPSIHDTNLEELKIMKQAEPIIDLNNPSIKFKAEFTKKELENCTEIGLITSDGVLICRDTFDTTKIPNVNQINLSYALRLDNCYINHNWLPIQGHENVYVTNAIEEITGVSEPENKTGYQYVITMEDLYSTPYSYYYDGVANKLYIHTNGVDLKTARIELTMRGEYDNE